MRITHRIATVVTVATFACGCSKSTDPTFDTDTDSVDATDAMDSGGDVPDTADEMDGTDPPGDTTDAADGADAPDDGFTDTIGMICANDADCQNGLYCDGAEICPYGFCQAGPIVDCDDGVGCTLDTCNEETDSCDHTPDDAACSDGDPCNGVETCDLGTMECQPGTPMDCNDGENCTLDSCDSTTGDCVHEVTDLACDDMDDCTIDTCDLPTDTCINTLIDDDGDLFAPESCGGPDCDDTDPDINPDAIEICDDGIDQDCDGADMPPGGCDCPVDIAMGSSYPGDTTGAASVYDPSCGYGTGSPEIVHRLDLAADAAVHLDIFGTYWDSVIHVHDGACDGPELGCHAGWDGTFVNLDLTAGTYYVIVDGEDSYSYGAFTLDVEPWVPPVPVTGNDTCATAHAIASPGSFGGSTTGMTDTGDGSCGWSLGLDVWFTFTPGTSGTVTADTMGSTYDTVLYVHEASCTGTEIACDDDTYGLLSEISFSVTAGTTYYLVLDAYDDYETGDWVLNITGF